MAWQCFKNRDLGVISEALDIAEDITVNYYKFSTAQWKRHRFDVKTLLALKGDEITQGAFALLNRGSGVTSNFELKTKIYDFYFICLQDHQILKATARDKRLMLLPLLVYIFTHELIHIVRFCNFFQRFDVAVKEREKEERIVHRTTFNILKNIPMPDLDDVLDSYQGYRICEIGAQ